MKVLEVADSNRIDVWGEDCSGIGGWIKIKEQVCFSGGSRLKWKKRRGREPSLTSKYRIVGKDLRCSGSVVGMTRVSSESQCPMLSTGRTRRRHGVQSSAPSRKLRFQLAKERKASTTLGIIMSAFTICWLPFFVLAIVRPFLQDQDAIPSTLSSLFLWLGYANSLLNPVIYATLNRDFRRPFQQILYFRCGSLNHMMREEFYQSQYGDPVPPPAIEDEPTCDLMQVSELKQAGHESFL
ncbi:5-hydroxytryptamine receptor 1B-like [Cimex lectularius]|uniref:G-protein coupled receptors family 1 profile domain-containing protein n=1 Tax=Cimex lectularius TaxID=79782 RepID=A0A8I6TFQ2_CIMLE|nr:5-hydroxytryptamine receptor 1B-like [Cimex lectularius]